MPDGLSQPEYLADNLNKAVVAHLEQRMGASTLKTLNFHLELICGVDLSRLASDPSGVEKGLRVLFGRGAEEIMRASIFAAFRAARLVPQKEYGSLEDAFRELYGKISASQKIL